VVRLIFSKFAELGTLHGVLRWLVDHDVELGMRLHAGLDKGELVWRRPNRMTLQNMLHSPVYAGIYAYGRRRVDPAASCRAGPAPAGSCPPKTSGWGDPGAAAGLHHSPAIPRQPGPAGGQRRPRRDPRGGTGGVGAAVGLARCGRCRRRMTVRYHLRGQATSPRMSAQTADRLRCGQRCQAWPGPASTRWSPSRSWLP
jgi:hypothetical protein